MARARRATDPLFDATAPTNGGGDTGSVLISPYIKPGTVSKRFYNHYSWLRTMEDLFGVARVSPGLDQPATSATPPSAVWRHSDEMCSTTLSAVACRPGRTPDIGRIVQASPGDPRLAIEGDTVAVVLGSGRGSATAVGPAVAERGLSPAETSVRCTFTVTLAARSGSLPVSPAAFSIVDELGQVHRPSVATTNGARLPAQVAAGHSVTLSLTTVLPVGGGRISWTPQGSRPIVAWDFDVETA